MTGFLFWRTARTSVAVIGEFGRDGDLAFSGIVAVAEGLKPSYVDHLLFVVGVGIGRPEVGGRGEPEDDGV